MKMHRRRKGLSLLETLLASVLTIIMAYQADMTMQNRSRDMSNVSAAAHLNILMEGTYRFIRDNGNCLTTTQDQSCQFGTVSFPLVVSPTSQDALSKNFLQTYLPPNFGNNAYQQGWRVVINQNQQTQNSTTTSPVYALILTGNDTANTEGIKAQAMNIGDASEIVSIASSSPYGMVGFQSSPNSIQGAYNGWSLNNASNLESSLKGLTIGDAQTILSTTVRSQNHGITLAAYVLPDAKNGYGDWLSRVVVPGHPEYNQMETDIDLNAHDLNNTALINFTDATSNLTTLQSSAAMGLVGQNLMLSSPTNGSIMAYTDTLTIGRNSDSSQNSSLTTNDSTHSLHIATANNGAIDLQSPDVYTGTPTKGTTGLYNIGSGVLRTNGIEVPSLQNIIVSTTTSTGGNVRVSLDDLMSRYRSQENWLALSGQSVSKPTCYGSAIPQIITTIHGFEGGVTQDTWNNALVPMRNIPMRVRAVDQGDTWQVLVEYLNPYTQCGGGANVWSTTLTQPYPDGTCKQTNATSSTSGADNNNYVIAQTYCYYAKTTANVVDPATESP